MNITEIRICSNDVQGDVVTKVVHASLATKNIDRTNPYIMKSVTGLDTDEIIKTYNDGPKFFRMRPSKRTVSFLIKLNPNYHELITVGDLRDKLYRAITFNTQAVFWNTDSKIEIQFMEGTKYVASLYGFVTKLEVDAYTAEPYVTLTIECEYPFLRSNEIINMGINNNPIPQHITYRSIDYPVGAYCWIFDADSNAPHGFQMNIQVRSAQSQCIIWDDRNPHIYLFWVVFDFLPGDVIRFSSNEDNKFVFVERSGVFYASLMDRYYWGSIWTFLLPGINLIKLSQGMRILGASTSSEYWGI